MASSSSPAPAVGPLNIGNLVSAALTLYRSHLKTYIGIAAKAYLWVFVPVYGWAKFYMLSGLISRLAYQELINQPETVSNAQNILQPKLWRFLLAALNVGIRLFLLYFVFVIVGSIIGGLSTALLAPIIGPVAYLLPAVVILAGLAVFVWFIGRWSIVELPIVVEDATSGEAVARSWELTDQAAYRVQTIIFVAFLITLPLLAVLSYIPTFLPLFLPEGSTLGLISTIFSWVGGIFAGIAIVPFWQTLKALIYYDLRSRKEGIDLKLRR